VLTWLRHILFGAALLCLLAMGALYALEQSGILVKLVRERATSLMGPLGSRITMERIELRFFRDAAAELVALRRGEIDGVVMNENVTTSMSWNVSSPSSIRSLKQKFARASEYVRELRAWQVVPAGRVKSAWPVLSVGILSRLGKARRQDVACRLESLSLALAAPEACYP